MVKMTTFKDRDDWLNARGKRIGGSDAASVMGMNPWMNNIELWKIKTWKKPQEDVSDNPAVRFGTKAEKHIRELFRLDHPELKVEYKENNLWTNSDMPYAHASLDGWLYDSRGRLGVLEIKTSTIVSQAQRDKWQPKEMPKNYFCQCLHMMNVTGAEFVYLRGYLRYDFDGEFWAHVKEYYFERSEVEDSLRELKDAEEKFWQYVLEDREPPLLLPGI